MRLSDAAQASGSAREMPPKMIWGGWGWFEFPRIAGSVAAILVLALLVTPGASPATAGTGPAPGAPLSFHGAASGGPMAPLTPTPVWTNVSSGTAPPARAGAGLAYDPVLGSDVLFGGCVAGDFAAVSCTPTNDTWAFAHGSWSRLNLTPSPPPRMRPAMVWDAADGYLLLFGGYTGSTGSVPIGDTWAFNGTAWANLTSSVGTGPGPRAGPAMVYASSWHRVVLFGGLTDLATETLVNDTWTFQNGSWTKVAISTAPPGRYDAAFTFDPTINSAVLYSGYAGLSLGSLGDTWLFNGTAWTQPPTTVSPAPRNGAASAFDPVANETVIFGGHASWTFYDDTWGYQAGLWSQVSVNTTPSTRWASSMTYDASTGTVLLFGGFVITGGSVNEYFSDTWTLDLGGNSSGGGGPPPPPPPPLTWTNVTPGISPAGRAGAAMAYDPVTQSAILFGGCVAGDYWQLNCTPSNDTWSYAGGLWTQLNPSVSPPARMRPAMVWDGADNYLLLFGGFTAASGSEPLGDTWAFNGSAWVNLTSASTSHPSPRAGPALVYSSAWNDVVLFGGLTDLPSETLVSDTWTFRNSTWTQVTTSGAPPARYDASMTWDASASDILLFGGFGGTTLWSLGDTWAFDGLNWTERFPSPSPPARNGASTAYDPLENATVVFGGHAGFSFYGDTWIFSGGTWTQILSNGSAPSMRWGAPMAFDPSVGGVVLFGGYLQWTTFEYFGDTWVLGTNASVPPPPPVPMPVSVVITATPLSGTAPLNVTLYANIAGGSPPFTVDWSLPTANGTGTPVGVEVEQTYSVAGWYPATAFVYNTTTAYGTVLVGFGSVWIDVLPSSNSSEGPGNGTGDLPVIPRSQSGGSGGGGFIFWGGGLVVVALSVGVGGVTGYLFGATRVRGRSSPPPPLSDREKPPAP